MPVYVDNAKNRLVLAFALGAVATWAALGSPPPCAGGNPIGQAILNLVCQ